MSYRPRPYQNVVFEQVEGENESKKASKTEASCQKNSGVFSGALLIAVALVEHQSYTLYLRVYKNHYESHQQHPSQVAAADAGLV